ncbi:MAG: Maf family protein [Rhodospirillales bacterium]|nr:Maf family protein [Rhodospirillales bacterium]
MNRLVLASGSRTRLEMLRRAGVSCEVDPPAVDEAALRASLRAEGADVAGVAEALAELKAMRIARRHPGALVLGADQMLECGGVWHEKPADRRAARQQLLALRGKTHMLVTVAVLVKDEQRIWHDVDRARMVMRPFTEAFLDWYLETAGDAVCASVGAYQVEGLGAQLFARIEGDQTTILGLPLMPVLDMLRVHGLLRT